VAPIVRISVNYGGREHAFLSAGDPVGEVSRLLQTYGYLSDVTVSIQLPDDQGLLLVALEDDSAFVGLETSGGVYQLIADASADGTRHFMIGGQPTVIDRRYVLPQPKVIELLAACLATADPFAVTQWERQ
jgi:hypothetical protein